MFPKITQIDQGINTYNFKSQISTTTVVLVSQNIKNTHSSFEQQMAIAATYAKIFPNQIISIKMRQDNIFHENEYT